MSRGARRRAPLAVVLSILVFTSGCFVVRSEAPPPPPHVRLLSETAPVQVTRKYQKWFGAWGLFPLSPADDPQYIIENEKLVEARITQEDSFSDIVAGFIFTVFFAGMILPQSVIVEGNRAPSGPDTALAQPMEPQQP